MAERPGRGGSQRGSQRDRGCGGSHLAAKAGALRWLRPCDRRAAKNQTKRVSSAERAFTPRPRTRPNPSSRLASAGGWPASPPKQKPPQHAPHAPLLPRSPCSPGSPVSQPLHRLGHPPRLCETIDTPRSAARLVFCVLPVRALPSPPRKELLGCQPGARGIVLPPAALPRCAGGPRWRGLSSSIPRFPWRSPVTGLLHLSTEGSDAWRAGRDRNAPRARGAAPPPPPPAWWNVGCCL